MIKDLHFVRSARAGKPIEWYVYAWRGGPRILKASGPKRPKLDAKVLKALATANEGRHGTDTRILRALCRAWRSLDPARKSSPEWERLSDGTKKTWGAALDRVEAKWGETPLTVWNDPRMVAKVVAWRDSRADTPRAADIGVTVLRALLEFGRLRGLVTFNAAAKIPTLYRNGQRAEIVWTDDDIARFTETAKRLNQNHVVDGLRLASLTGLRRADLVSLTWGQVGLSAIVKRALKRSGGKRRDARMPRIPALNMLLDELRLRARREGVETVLVNSEGRAWTGDGFGGAFNRIRDAAEILHLDEESGEHIRKHLHDVRGTFCTKLLVDGELTDQEIANIMGWAPDRVSGIRRIYVDQSRVMIALGERLNRIA